MTRPTVKPGDRVTWNVYGIQYTGTVVTVFGDDAAFYDPGDILVKVDGSIQPPGPVINYQLIP